MKETAKRVLIVACVFAPFLVVIYGALAIPNLQVLRNFGGEDWIWLILLAGMMLGLYYFLAIYIKEEREVAAQFERMDRDRDGFISLEDAGSWADLRDHFPRFDADRDGRMSRADFNRFERYLFSH